MDIVCTVHVCSTCSVPLFCIGGTYLCTSNVYCASSVLYCTVLRACLVCSFAELSCALVAKEWSYFDLFCCVSSSSVFQKNSHLFIYSFFSFFLFIPFWFSSYLPIVSLNFPYFAFESVPVCYIVLSCRWSIQDWRVIQIMPSPPHRWQRFLWLIAGVATSKHYSIGLHDMNNT